MPRKVSRPSPPRGAAALISPDTLGPVEPEVPADQSGPEPAKSVEQLSVPKLIALHIVPGAIFTVAFVLFAPIAQAAGFPPITALFAAILLVLIPVELVIVLRAVRRYGAAAALPYRERL